MNHGDELSSIDFSAMMGSPLNAAVEAQIKSALATVDFIKQVGFEPDTVTNGVTTPGKVRSVTFSYDKLNPLYDPTLDANDTGNDDEATLTYNLTVPTLAIVPIPYLRVEDVTIQFNAKIASTTYQRNSTAESFGGNLSAKAGWGWGSARLSAYYSKRKSTVSGSTVNRTYALDVKIHAVQDEIPAGLERVLGILEDLITETPSDQTAVTA